MGAAPQPRCLSTREWETVRAFAEAFIDPADAVLTPAEIAANIDHYLANVDSNRIRSLRLSLFLVEYILPRLEWWPFQPRFSHMGPARRRQMLQRKLAGRRPRLFRDLARIRSIFALGYYGDKRVQQHIGHPPVTQRPQFSDEQLRPLGLPAIVLHEPQEEVLTAEVCVIGSGAGGAVVAAGAAASGRDVIVLEAGQYVPASQIHHDEAAMLPRIYKEGGLQTTVDMDLTILQAQTLGGTTMLNNHICFRLGDRGLTPTAGPDTLEKWARLGARIDRQALESAYDRVEAAIGVRPLLQAQEPGVPTIDGPNGRLLLEGWMALQQQRPELQGFASGLFRKNVRRCLGCGYCNLGCPYERKMSMLETYLPRAVEAGARIVTACQARQIERQGNRATAVRARLADGRPLTIRAENIVVAAGAIGSSVLLMRSGIRRNVGTRFSFNAGLPVLARFPEPVDAFAGVQMATYVDGVDFLLESLFYPPALLASIMPGWFTSFQQRMGDYRRYASAGVLVGTEANGRVKRSALARSLFGPVNYQMTAGDMDKMKQGVVRLAEIYFAAGAETVLPAAFAECEMPAADYAGRPQAMRQLLDARIRRPDDLILGSAHPQGGNPMSDEPSVGVVDSNLAVHGVDNLFVCDASVFPTTVRINPQLTIMALADYFVQLGRL